MCERNDEVIPILMMSSFDTPHVMVCAPRAVKHLQCDMVFICIVNLCSYFIIVMMDIRDGDGIWSHSYVDSVSFSSD